MENEKSENNAKKTTDQRKPRLERRDTPLSLNSKKLDPKISSIKVHEEIEEGDEDYEKELELAKKLNYAKKLETYTKKYSGKFAPPIIQIVESEKP